MSSRFRFRPRYRGIAISAIGIGGTLAVVAIAALGAAFVPLGSGALGVVVGAAYMLSPTWKLEVIVDDEAIEVSRKFRLPWSEVVRVVASPKTNTCFVDGGVPERSLLVPGDGAPAPYDLERKAELVAAILAHVPADKVKTVDSLAKANETPG